MPLAANLSTKLDAQSLVDGLAGSLTGPMGGLSTVSVPINTADLQAAASGTASLDSSPIGGAIAGLSALAGPVLQALPIGHELMAPLTDILTLIEKVTDGELTRAVSGLRAQLATGFTSNDPLIAAVLHASQVLARSPEAQLLRSDARLVADLIRIPIPTQLPLADVVQAADNSLRLFGGMMALDSSLMLAEQLTGSMLTQLDAGGLRAKLATLQLSLDGAASPLSAVVANVSPGDAAQVANALASVTDVAVQLAAIDRSFSAGMAAGEAALAYLDVDRLELELTAASTVLRTANLDSLKRVLDFVAAKLSVLTALGASAEQALLSGLVAAAESQIAQVAAKLRATDVAAFVAPFKNAIDQLTALIGRIDDVITSITVGFESAMNTVKGAIAALPVQAIVDAIDAFVKPITDALAKIEQIIETVHAALQTVADATHALIDQVGAILDKFKSEIDALFGGARDFVLALQIDQVVGQINDGIRAFSDVLGKAQMKPYFDTADNVIETTADVISKIPFGLLPDSMKQKVDDAVQPIKAIDPTAVQTEIEDLLDFEPDPNDATKRIFAARSVVEDAIHDVQVKYDDLIATIKTYDPHKYLASLDSQLKGVADAVNGWSPALTLQPLTDAVNQVKAAILGFDLQIQLEPVDAVFAEIAAKIDEFNPSALVQPIEERITSARTKLYDLIKIKQWLPAIDGLEAQGNALLSALDPTILGAQLEATLTDAFARLKQASPNLNLPIGMALAAQTRGLGLRISAESFQDVSGWLSDTSGDTALRARAARVADALGQARDGVQALDVATLTTDIVQRMSALRQAVTTLASGLDANSPAASSLLALAPRLQADVVFGGLAASRSRYLGTLVRSATLAEGLRNTGFSEVNDAAHKWQAALVPLQPARDLVKELLLALGVTGTNLSLVGVLQALANAVSPSQMASILAPIFAAVRERIQSVITAVVAPVKAGIQKLTQLLDDIDLKPLTDAINGVFDEVKSQISALAPENLLKGPLDAVKALQNTLRTSDPLQQVIQIITNLRDAVTALLQKLDSNRLLETPLQIYDHVLLELSKLKLEHLLDPVFNELDGIAEQVHEGLTHTVAAFVKLQDSLPSDSGGTAGAVSAGVSVAGSLGI